MKYLNKPLFYKLNHPSLYVCILFQYLATLIAVGPDIEHPKMSRSALHTLASLHGNNVMRKCYAAVFLMLIET
jgi:hypothetical protein